MLRTILPQESLLVQYCRSKDWTAVISRLQTHPHEASPTEACLGGEGTTVVALAVRCGAPKQILEALLAACPHQVAVVNRQRGSILHEALVHESCNEILSHLVRTISEYQKMAIKRLHKPKKPVFADDALFMHVGIQESRIVSCNDIFLAQDDLGRTALHLVIKRLMHASNNTTEGRSLLQSIVSACPEAAMMFDSDGFTPLLWALYVPRLIDDRSIQILVEACPEAVTTCRKMMMQSWNQRTCDPRAFSDTIPASKVSQSPLYFALLNRRSLTLILLLIKESRSLGVRPCSAIVTSHHEVPLHVAITTRSPISTIYHVATDRPSAILLEDAYGLNSLDWLWIRHVLDWHTNPLVFSSSHVISRRRHVDRRYLAWQARASVNMPIGDIDSLPVNPVAVRGLQEDLLQRMKILLPMAASAMAPDECSSHSEHWSLIHAACLVPCPVAMIRAALNMVEETQHYIRTKDYRAGRLPLHYAAARAGYTTTVPVGVTRRVEVIQEQSPVFDVVAMYPEACFETDLNGQLPFHIAIDTGKKARASLLGEILDTEAATEELPVLSVLLSYNPGALEKRDGKTKLLPLQQAAAGVGSSIDAVFFLLRQQPTALLKR